MILFAAHVGANAWGVPSVFPDQREGYMPAKGSHSIRNRLLAALPPAELARLRAKLEPVNLVLGQMLTKSNMSIDQVYFPQTGMISLIRPLHDRTTVEVGVVGREGFVGMGVVLGGDINILGKMVQIAGTALTIPMDFLHQELDHCPVLTMELLRFVRALLSQVSQSSACNRMHHVQERLARWLLMARDRVDSDGFPLRHEFLCMMLGAKRPGVTAALGVFAKAGLIRHGRGQIEILNRRGLEAAACECYDAIRKEYKRLLP
jgi:CRP-like cAMP-binding protein